MSQSSDPGHFFQTETALATAARRAAKANNKSGNPLKATSKILSLLLDPLSANRIYIAESCGIVRRVDLDKEDIKSALYRGFTTPATCLAITPRGETLFAGSWEKKILAWDTATRQVKATFTGHTDFVKSLLYIPRGKVTGLLLSGSSDANIIIWDAVTGERLATLRGHTRAVGTMAVDPVLSSEAEAVVLAGGSEREIRRWRIPLDRPGVAVESGERIVEFETNVHRLKFIGEDADCWGASADGTARRLEVRAEGEKKVGERSEMVLSHGDYVNDVVLAGAGGRWVVTACRDEEVRVWDAASGQPYHTFTGHADEVTGLVVLGERGELVVSISIDCTVRRWSLQPADLKEAREEAQRLAAGKEVEKPVENKLSTLTEEEERELAELMEDSD